MTNQTQAEILSPGAYLGSLLISGGEIRQGPQRPESERFKGQAESSVAPAIS